MAILADLYKTVENRKIKNGGGGGGGESYFTGVHFAMAVLCTIYFQFQKRY